MNFNDLIGYLIPLFVVGFFAWRLLRFKKIKADLPALIANGAVIIDVRSASEFRLGSRPDSLNIPLNEINSRVNELDKKKPIILCCASGARSGMAVGILKKNGFSNVINAGPWTNTL